MANLIDLVTSQLGSGGLSAIAGQLGIGEDKAQSAVQTGLSVLTGALARNAAKPAGAASLDQALAKDHDGGIFDRIGDFLGNAAGGPGAGILGHVLGRQQGAVTAAVGQQTGLSPQQSGNLLVTLAPLVMGALGKMKAQQGLDASGVAGALAAEKQQIEQGASGGLAGLLSMVGGAGGAAGILGKLMGFLKGLFGKKS
ncbi:MAG: DUF937 domain-containing protein [Acidimicrobiia bacterium]|nr:DUF937 domain-containing protein [Acidimicrobiia bacterium]